MLREKVETWVDEALGDDSNLFVLDLTIGPHNAIKVVIDGDLGVTVSDCIKVSRAIEAHFDRDTEDFSLEVTSAGATSPLQLPRQYKKNIGRKIKIQTPAETVEGQLTAVSGEGVIVEWKAREPKPVGKGKHTVQKKVEIPFSDIEKANILIKF
ncbi:MAG: ribosome assembly cofactor RimP [Flavobacteriaceae bacterium]